MKAGAELDKEVLDISSSDKITKTHTDKLQILLEERSAAKSQTFSQLAETKDSVIKLIKGKENPSIITRFGELLSDPSIAVSRRKQESLSSNIKCIIELSLDKDSDTLQGCENIVLLIYAMVELSLKRGADTECDIGDKTTPLMHAARKNHLDIVKLLIQSGANVDASNSWGYDSLNGAAGRGYEEVAIFLV